MRILECIHSLRPGGAERLLVDLSNELSLEHEVIILTLKNRDSQNENFYKNEILPRVRFVSLGFEDGFHLSYLFRVYKTIKSLKPDVVHLHCILQYLLLPVLFYKKCLYVQTLHNKMEYGIPHRLRRLVIWLIRNKFLRFVTISDTNRQSFRDYTGLTNDILIYNGRKQPAKTASFNEVKRFVDTIRGHDADIVLLCIAKCAPQKNLQLLINSVNLLAAKGLKLKVLIIGDSYQESKLGKGLIALARSNPDIRFLGAMNNVADYFYSCDAFCLSSLYEGMPITLIEAMACRCIPLSTPVSGVVDLIEDGKTGFISKDFSESSYVDTLLNFVANRQKINKDELFKLFQDHFSIEKCAKSYLGVFNGKYC